MQMTTVTLPGGTAAVVHSEGTAWSPVTVRRNGGRAGLVKDLLELVDAEAASLGCAALRQASTAAGNVVVDDGHGVLYAQVRVLCTHAECRALAEHCEKVGKPDPDAAAARAWALAQASADHDRGAEQPVSPEQIDPTTVVATYFEDRISEAQKEVEEAQAALAAAQAKVAQREVERDAFARDGALPPPAYNSPTGQPEWDLCQWAQTRSARVAFKDMTPGGDAVFNRLRAEEKAAHTWLREHGYTVPDPFGGKA